MPIKFRCPLCQRKIRVRDEFAGKRGGCPNCKQPIDIPAESTLDEHDNPVGAADPGETPPVEAATATAEVEEISPKEAARLMQSRQSGREAPKSVDDTAAVPSATAGSFIRFDCPNCAKPMGFPSAMASQAATCPACRARVMIPERSGELSFLVGAVPREARTGSGARTGLAAAPREAEAGGKPPWKPVAIGAGVIVLALILGLMIGRGSGGDADAKSAPGSEKTEKSEKTIAAQTPALQVSPPRR
ncbi:MAG: hypothetical protein M5U26_09785 [Planctomycetota bacterium]|nr:hypothetical protein [Planctomycetota bacterium]